MLSLGQQGSSAPVQGSDAWLKLREKRMTGSKPSSIMFDLKSAEDWDRLWNEMFGDAKPKPFSDEARARMDYGSRTEDTAAALIQKVVPGSIFFECPLIPHSVYNWIACSPDGYLVQFEHDSNGVPLPSFTVKKRYNIEM